MLLSAAASRGRIYWTRIILLVSDFKPKLVLYYGHLVTFTLDRDLTNNLEGRLIDDPDHRLRTAGNVEFTGAVDALDMVWRRIER